MYAVNKAPEMTLKSAAQVTCGYLGYNSRLIKTTAILRVAIESVLRPAFLKALHKQNEDNFQPDFTIMMTFEI